MQLTKLQFKTNQTVEEMHQNLTVFKIFIQMGI